MMRAWRSLRGLVPVCTLTLMPVLVLASQLHFSPLGPSGGILPAPAAGYETAWHPYMQRDGAVYSVCLSSRSGMILPPFINPDAPTPVAVAASNPPMGGAL